MALNTKALIFAFDQGLSYVGILWRSVFSAHAKSFEWARSHGFYVAVTTTDAGSPQGMFRCFGKCAEFPILQGSMNRLIAWHEPEYLGPYGISGDDIQVPRIGVYGQGMSFCDSYVEVGGDQYSMVEHSVLRLAKKYHSHGNLSCGF